MKPVIVYLAQNTARDPQYNRDSRSLLEKSLDLLYKNYNDRFKHDILIFHEGDFKPKDQEEIAQGRKEIKFQYVDLSLPDFLPKEEVPEFWGDGDSTRFGMGYRHMIRFFAVRLFRILNEMGYDWVMRLDDDSFIHSPIDYDLFEFMEKKGYEYGYRVDIDEPESTARGFGEELFAYIRANQINPTFFYERCQPTGIKTQVSNLVKTLAMRINPRKHYQMDRAYRYDLWGYYNNFFISKLSFWLSKDVQHLMNHFDRVGGWYKHRWGDLNFQSAAVQIFLPKEKLYKFTDWTYEHATFKQGKLFWGGIYPGDKYKDSEVVKSFRAANPGKVPCGY